MRATRSKTRKSQAANTSKPRVSFAYETPTAAARTSTTTPEKKLSPASYMNVLYKRRDALQECPLGDSDDSETSNKAKGKGRADGLSSGDRVSQLRSRVRGALQDADPWIELGRVLKLQSTLGGTKYIGTSLTPAGPIPLPEPYTDVFPETEEEWDDLRQKTAVVEKVRGWVKSVENSVVEEEPARKRKRQSASASPARKKRKEEKGAVVCGYDPKDPSPLGFVVAKRVPVQAKRGSPKVLVPDSSPARPPSSSSPPPLHKDTSSPEDAEMKSPPPPRASISSVPEDAFFPPSFPSDLVTSTPKPVEVGNESSDEDAPPVKTADLRSKPLSTAKAPPSSSKPPVPIAAPKPLSSANLARHRDSKLYLDIDLASPTKSLSSIAGDDEDDEDDEVLLGAAGLADEEAEHGMQFDWQSEADDLEGFLERDVSMYGDQDEEESPSHRVEYHREAEERDGQEQDEDTMFGKWFNLPRKSASTSASGAGGWFGRR